jgi:D-3-phosphoglycerate dehydrogenase / 2-oxoglutarate reductase
MPLVLVTDSTFDNLDVERGILGPLGCQIDSRQCKTPAELIEAVPNADFVITQFAPINGTVIGAMTKARVIVRYGIGVDNVDLDAARARGIPVCNVPDYCIDEVADQTMAFILGATRQVVPNCAGVRSGAWRLTVPLDQMKTLRDLTVGVVGCGRIGREVIRRLIPFKCRVLAFDPAVQATGIAALGAHAVGSLADLLAGSDVVTLHCPSGAQTRKMINAYALALLRPGAILVNLSRGDLVDTDALVSALQSGRLGAAALDVCDPEPIPSGHPLLGLENVIVSPHIASASTRAVRSLRETAAATVARAFRGEPLPNVVNGVDRTRFG